MANKNTNPVGGKTAVPAGINNAQPAYFPQEPRQPRMRNADSFAYFSRSWESKSNIGMGFAHCFSSTSTLDFNF